MCQIFISQAKSSAFEIEIPLLFALTKTIFFGRIKWQWNSSRIPKNSIQKSRIKAWPPISEVLIVFSLLFLAESKPKELPPLMPVMMIKAITQDKKSTLICYECPIYKTRQRGPTYVWTFELKTKGSPSKWVLAGVALLLQN